MTEATSDEKKTAEGKARRCKIKGCKRPFRAKGYCVTHYKAWRRGELPRARYRRCKKEGCGKPMARRGYCAEHAAKSPAPPPT